MGRTFTSKSRNAPKRKPKPIIVIIAEGKNVTETQYFRHFYDQNSNYNIRPLIVGHRTDPESMLKAIEDYWKRNELSEENGDIAFVVLDLDCDEKKAHLINKLSAKTNAHFVVSNPCFEIWFLLHFKYTTHAYLNSQELIRDIKAFIPNYEKNMDVEPILHENAGIALKNAERLQKHYEQLSYEWPSEKCNPRTDVPDVFKAIEERRKRY